MSCTILKPTSLTKKQISEINILVSICNTYDNTNYVFDEAEDFKSETDVNSFLLYSDNQLLSVISLFAPKKTEAELLAFTLPLHRRKGYFWKLLQEVETELKRRETNSILFVCNHISKEGNLTILKTAAAYEYSEFLMSYDRNGKCSIVGAGKVAIVKAREHDKSRLAQINKNAFIIDDEEAIEIIDGIFKSDRRKLYSILYENVLVGMIGIYAEIDRKYIYGFCVDKEYQGQGIGKQALQNIVNVCLKEKSTCEIVLEVQTDNENALKLYTQVGFHVVTEFRYYRKNITN
ncbi:MAG: GNAT family N-acetyltransferase [Bacteroidetes bacterium]|nr:GNAT family N-acetyltransferase [Bacteroidota bacterium]